MAKKPKYKKRSWYIKKLDKIAKDFAKQRDGYICQKSGEHVEKSNAHGSHVVPVSAGHALRFDLMNIKCLSYHNHLNWWHKNPLEAGEWFKQTFPDRFEYLEKRKYTMIKILDYQLHEFYEEARKCENWEEYVDVYNKHFDKFF